MDHGITCLVQNLTCTCVWIPLPKPSTLKTFTDGDVNSIELFDEHGDMILQMLNANPGLPELNE
jgi:putative heme degradation protein